MDETQLKFAKEQFEKRKGDHIALSLSSLTQTQGLSGLDKIQLIHEALPDLDFSEILTVTDLFARTDLCSIKLSLPIFISSMTAGHAGGVHINAALARFSERRNILMGVGSQRRELFDSAAAQEWVKIRKESPGAILMANIGVSQLIRTSSDQILKLVDSIEACGIFIHLNALQECMQPEGTPHFKGALKALERLAKSVSVPVVVKETGCGFSPATLERLIGCGVYAVDVSGLGGTHWGRVEGLRSEKESFLYRVSQSFANWGISTVDSLLAGISHETIDYKLWASGGVRSGLDAAKLLAIGAEMVGLAQPFLVAAMASGDQDKNLDVVLDQLEYELKVAMFCTGCRELQDLKSKKSWQHVKI